VKSRQAGELCGFKMNATSKLRRVEGRITAEYRVVKFCELQTFHTQEQCLEIKIRTLELDKIIEFSVNEIRMVDCGRSERCVGKYCLLKVSATGKARCSKNSYI
jgi:hypothetical protein